MLNKKKHSNLWIYFSAIVFATIMVGFLLVLGVWFILFELNVIPISLAGKHLPIVWFFFGSILVGVMIALFVGKIIIKPMENMSNAFGELSKGNFSVRLPDNEGIKEIRDMANCFNSMAYDLSNIETLRNDFVVNVSHEFKTPIASIEGYATLLQNENLPAEKRERYVKKILDNSSRLSNLLTNILALSKLENQEEILNKSNYRIDEQLRKCVLLLEEKWQKKNIEFDIEMSKNTYYGCEPLLDQVWFNIIDNAIKYSDDKGKIAISLMSGENNITVTISDNGTGMTDEVKKHIFEKFYQADGSRKAEGNGLGLSLVKRIVDLCGGEISVESQVGKGTKFMVILPN